MRGLCVLMVCLSAAAPAAAEQLRTERTDPEHLRGFNRPYIAPQPGLPRTRYIRAQVVYRLPADLPELATPDKSLSHLCQRGAFTQQTNGFYWARTPSRSYGVAFSGGANLNDPQNRRKPGKVYFFEDQESRCTVWIADQAKLMAHYVGPRPGD
ncbi:MAG TPA: hypothetical protein VD978_31950 [Azospirillum sp.]|nr:hypothetical protein [Azospirillum sp.]